jgi:hypothetical protein
MRLDRHCAVANPASALNCLSKLSSTLEAHLALRPIRMLKQILVI